MGTWRLQNLYTARSAGVVSTRRLRNLNTAPSVRVINTQRPQRLQESLSYVNSEVIQMDSGLQDPIPSDVSLVADGELSVHEYHSN